MAKKSFLGFVMDQFRKVAPVAKADLTGKTVIVVGANTGLGYETSKHFARMGAGRLILACRNSEKGEAAVKRLEEETGYSKAELWLVDLSEFASVRAFADRAIKELERLDILVLNAATTTELDGKYTSTVDGWETALQVNDLSLSLIALLLLPQIIETAEKYKTLPRIVVVSSEVHFWASFEEEVLNSTNAFETLSSEKYCTPENLVKHRYHHTKLLNVFFTRALSNRLGDQPVIVDTVNPGFCYSELRRGMSGSIRMWVFETLLARSTEEGSRQIIWAAVGGGTAADGDSAKKLRGAYVSMSDVTEPSDHVLGEEGKKREEKLWNDLICVLEKTDTRVRDVVSAYLID